MQALRVREALVGIVLLTSCSASTAQTWWTTGRIINEPGFHAGIRPAMTCGAVACDRAGVTLRITTDLTTRDVPEEKPHQEACKLALIPSFRCMTP